MCASDILQTIANSNGEICVKSAKAILKELKVATVALRRINFLSKTFGSNNPHLTEIEKISNEILTEKKSSHVK